jgi:hypothetical protein
VADASGQAGPDTDIMAIKVDRDGTALWGERGRSAAVARSEHSERSLAAVPDGLGGVIVAFEIEYTGGVNQGDVDVGAQRFSASGLAQWSEPGSYVLVSSGSGAERLPAVVPDGEGGAIIVFEFESRADPGDPEIFAQRLAPDGSLAWFEGQRAAGVAYSGMQERRPVAVGDGKGGAIVVFETRFPPGSGRVDADLFAQRVSGDGRLVWNDGSRSALVSTSPSFHERNPTVLTDGAGGAFVVLEAAPVSGGDDVDVWAQHLDPDGTALWNSGARSALVAATEHRESRPSIAPRE